MTRYSPCIYPVLTLIVLVAGCQSNPSRDEVCEIQVVEVKVPVPVRMQPPADLMALPTFPDGLPEWLEPTDRGASSALSKDGETRLRLQLLEYVIRDEAWREWAAQEK